jgi:hypothetical protein
MQIVEPLERLQQDLARADVVHVGERRFVRIVGDRILAGVDPGSDLLRQLAAVEMDRWNPALLAEAV